MNRAERNQNEIAIPLDLAWLGHDSGKYVPHICVCVCSFRKPRMLRRLLLKLNDQVTEGLFTYSVVVADYDIARSAAHVVNRMSTSCKVPIRYCVEPRQKIAWARNKAIEHAEGAFVALIDEEEFPEPTWLLSLYQNLCDYRVDGVLGAVKRHFEDVPPAWFRKSGIYVHRVKATGTAVNWSQSSTSNALLKRGIFACDSMPFRTDLRGGEDQDFFRRKIESGYRFIWSAEAQVSETITPGRWKRTYILRKALQLGASCASKPEPLRPRIIRSLVAVPAYVLLAPVTLLGGQQHFMKLMMKLCRHTGMLMMRAGIDPAHVISAPE